MKTVAVFFDAPGYDDYPFTVEEYFVAYHEIARLIRDRGAQLCIVRSQDSYLGNNVFSHGWRFDGTTFVADTQPVKADLIYDKGHFTADANAHLFNSLELDDLCTDKWKTFQLFPVLCPKTFLVYSTAQLEQALSSISSNRIVAKPQGGEEGKGVLIDTPENIRKDVTTFPYLIQEFLDTTGGIPGLVEGPHDFRIVCINGEPAVSYIRTPPPGQLRANVAQGGKEIEVLPERIPHETLEIMRAVDRRFSSFIPRVYSIDMGRTAEGKWKIIELNSKPALSRADQGVSYPRFQRLLVEALLSVA